jgi:type II secretory pathway component PulJ
LVELLLALAITTVLVLLLVNVVSATLNVWEQGRNQIDTFASARQTLDRIADEIKGAIASPAPRQVDFSENLALIKGTTDPQAKTSENIFFVGPYPNSMSGDLCIIAYRHNSDTHTLERGFIESQTAWKSAAATRYQPSAYTASDWQWRVVADGVLEFEVRSYSQQDLDDPANPAPADTWNSAGATSTMVGNTPRRAVVRIKLVDDRTVAKLNGLLPGNPTYDRLVNRAAREFMADVTLPPPH